MATGPETPDKDLDDLDAATVEDLDVEEEAEDVRGGTWNCGTLTR